MVPQLVVSCIQVVQLFGFVASFGCVMLVLGRRARTEWLKEKRGRKTAAVEPAPSADNVPVGNRVKEEERGQVQQAEGRLWSCLWTNRSRKQEHGSFLKSAGEVLLVFDLVVSVVRIASMCLRLQARFFKYRFSDRDEYLSGLAVETAFLQSLWIIYTHFRIIACLRQREAQVTGNLFRVPCCIILAWLTIGLGPVILAHSLGIGESVVRDPVSAVGSVIGIFLILYLLFIYRGTLRAFKAATYEIERRRGSHKGAPGASGEDTAEASGADVIEAVDLPEKSSMLKRFIWACITAADDITAELCPDMMDVRAEDLDLSENGSPKNNSPHSSRGSPHSHSDNHSSGSGRQIAEQPPHVNKVEQRLRKSLRRVLKVYAATFMCVICAGIISTISELAISTNGQALMTLFDLPYAFMGVTDAIMVGGLGKQRRKYSKDALEEIRRRRRRERGEAVVADGI